MVADGDGLDVRGDDDLIPDDLRRRVATGNARHKRALLNTQVHFDPQQAVSTRNGRGTDDLPHAQVEPTFRG